MPSGLIDREKYQRMFLTVIFGVSRVVCGPACTVGHAASLAVNVALVTRQLI